MNHSGVASARPLTERAAVNDDHVLPCAAEPRGGGKPGESRPDDHHVSGHGKRRFRDVGERRVVPPERCLAVLSASGAVRVPGGPGGDQRLIIYSTVTSSTWSDSVLLPDPGRVEDVPVDDIRIGEVARRVGVSPSTLRAWERRDWCARCARAAAIAAIRPRTSRVCVMCARCSRAALLPGAAVAHRRRGRTRGPLSSANACAPREPDGASRCAARPSVPVSPRRT